MPSTSPSVLLADTFGIDQTLREDPVLPAGAPPWVPMLALWPSIEETSFTHLVALCDGDAPQSWGSCQEWLTEAGVCEPFSASDCAALVVKDSWLTPLDIALGTVVDTTSVREWFSRAADQHAREGLLAGIQQWARRSGHWSVLNDLWLVLSEHASGVADGGLQGFLDLPVEARREFPALTWACAMAEASAVQPPKSRAETFLSRLLLDSALLHADWSVREDTDQAVSAGAMRMLGERWLPPSSRPLEAAWRTKCEVDAFIDERSRKGQPPGRFAHAFFRMTSALLALLRADMRGAVEEARWAAILAEKSPVAGVARAVEILANSLAGARADVREDGGVPTGFQFGGFPQMAAVMIVLARGHQSLQTLDRSGVEATLIAVTPDMAVIAGVWAPFVSLRAFHSGLWGQPAEGLDRLLASPARQPLAAREQEEPNGIVVLGRAREFLLSRIGASSAALGCADSLPDPFRAVCQARARLWAGQSGLAVRVVEAALPSPSLVAVDRDQMLLIRGAATALEGRVPADIRMATEAALREVLRTRRYLTLALLPAAARNAVLELSDGLGDDPEAAAGLLEVLPLLCELNGSGAKGMLRLTEREQVLLPLLSTDLTVPEIAARLNVSANTVRKQVTTLREKFAASSRAEMVRKASVSGVIGQSGQS